MLKLLLKRNLTDTRSVESHTNEVANSNWTLLDQTKYSRNSESAYSISVNVTDIPTKKWCCRSKSKDEINLVSDGDKEKACYKYKKKRPAIIYVTVLWTVIFIGVGFLIYLGVIEIENDKKNHKQYEEKERWNANLSPSVVSKQIDNNTEGSATEFGDQKSANLNNSRPDSSKFIEESKIDKNEADHSKNSSKPLVQNNSSMPNLNSSQSSVHKQTKDSEKSHKEGSAIEIKNQKVTNSNNSKSGSIESVKVSEIDTSNANKQEIPSNPLDKNNSLMPNSNISPAHVQNPANSSQKSNKDGPAAKLRDQKVTNSNNSKSGSIESVEVSEINANKTNQPAIPSNPHMENSSTLPNPNISQTHFQKPTNSSEKSHKEGPTTKFSDQKVTNSNNSKSGSIESVEVSEIDANKTNQPAIPSNPHMENSSMPPNPNLDAPPIKEQESNPNQSKTTTSWVAKDKTGLSNTDSAEIQNGKQDTAAEEVLKKNDAIPQKNQQLKGSNDRSKSLEKQVASKSQPTQDQTMPSDTNPVPTLTPEQQSKNKLMQKTCIITVVLLACVLIALTLYYFLKKAPSKADKQRASVKNSTSDDNASQEIEYAEMVESFQ